jgi:hypothetical protein
MDDDVSFITLSPVHVSKLKARLHDIVVLKDQIQGTIKTFQHYSAAGDQLCKCMRALSSSLAGFSDFQRDPAICSLSRLLETVSDNFAEHFSQVQSIVVTRLRKFIDTTITPTEEIGKRSDGELDNYFKCLDAYMVKGKKESVAKIEERKNSLINAHFQAALSSFDLDRAITLVEKERLIEVTANFLSFVDLIRVNHKQSHLAAESTTETTQELQLSLPDVIKSIEAFRQQTPKLKQRVSFSTTEYWSRLGVRYPGTSALEHEGHLWKRGSGLTKSWARRYFVCSGHALSYYHTAEDSGSPSGRLDLLLTSVKPLKDADHPFSFTVISQSKTYVLQALSQWDMEEWMTVLMNNIEHLLNHSGEVARPLPGPSQQADPRLVNKTCADCGAGEPTWCCLNWGTCICIRCSGCHREMTTSVSKVRSLTLDRLDTGLSDLFAGLGNAAANEILEAKIGKVARPVQSATQLERMAFLKRKYAACEFVDCANLVDIKAAIDAEDLKQVFIGMCQHRNLKIDDKCLLHYAAGRGNATVTLLVGLNVARLNELDEQGWSALSYAAYFGHADTCQGLLAIGCDPNVSETAHPYAVACSRGFANVQQLFVPYWAKGDPPLVQYTPAIAVSAAAKEADIQAASFATFLTIRTMVGNWASKFTQTALGTRGRSASTFEVPDFDEI